MLGNDITMCSNTTCPLKKNCYRSQAIPNKYRQSYSFIEPVTTEGLTTCSMQIQIKKRKTKEDYE